jgi:hypothetical protein
MGSKTLKNKTLFEEVFCKSRKNLLIFNSNSGKKGAAEQLSSSIQIFTCLR